MKKLLAPTLVWAAALVRVCAAARVKDGEAGDLLGAAERLAGLEAQSQAHTRCGTQVFVMLPLDVVASDGRVSNSTELELQLRRAQQAGVDGFMVDVWWGLTEQEPRVYNFAAYRELVAMAEGLHLKVQLVASFHQCGGNIGDSVNIPLPEFVKRNQGIWYKDRAGTENKEYISLFADDVRLQDGRTPLEMYSEWMVNLSATFDDKLGAAVTEIQVGMGPAGELRYPSYAMANGWEYCGVGEFQAWDRHALESLRSASRARAEALPEALAWTEPPVDAGTYNSRPHEVPFFNHTEKPGYGTEYGMFFLDWYFGALKAHAAKVLQRAAAAFGQKVALAGKVSGIHWWYGSPSHAAELTAGYYNANRRNGYREVAQVFRENGNAALDFTCLEMRNPQQGAEDKCASRPETLVSQVLSAAQESRVQVNGENALPVKNRLEYKTILQKAPYIHAFTLLRLNAELVDDANLPELRDFVTRMHDCPDDSPGDAPGGCPSPHRLTLLGFALFAALLTAV